MTPVEIAQGINHALLETMIAAEQCDLMLAHERSHIVDHSEPAGAFDAAALKAVMNRKFTPAIKDGKLVSSRISVPISFDPKGDPDTRKS